MAIAVTCLVAAIVLLSIRPPDEPLGQLLQAVDPALPARLQSFELTYLGAWMWQGVTVRLLVRPAWLLPLMASIVSLGAVFTVSWRAATPVKRRRRS